MPAVKQISHRLSTESKFLPNLERLVLKDMMALEELPSLGQLPSLKVLRIERMPAVKKVGYGFFGSRDQGKCLPSLEKLKFRDMPELEEWSWADGRRLFPCLRILEIVECLRLKRLPPLPPVETLRLDKVGLTEVAGLREGIHGGDSCITASLSSMEISQCLNLRNLEEGLLSHSFPNIGDIAILECAELVLLPEKEFKELTSLKKLSIRSCPKLLSMTRDGDIDIPLPPSIEELVLFDCGNMRLPVHRVSSSNVAASPETTSISEILEMCLTALRWLEFKDCKNLQSLPIELHAFPSLCLLTIIGCPEIQALPEKGLPTEE
uniref:Uncharacterized protein n=1 Tax=Musa acuminata subsp. malaccensis TaxID=214687 RepID=A0A804IFC1_MUSAM